jgi:NTP pyrophosphatase (non-canonical NTP hydrolase)
MSGLSLEANPKMEDFQKYIKDMMAERGFDKNNIFQQMLLLSEEIGELAKAVRKAENLDVESAKEAGYGSVQDELADVLMYILSVANNYDIDLEQAFRKKEEQNKTRNWK